MLTLRLLSEGVARHIYSRLKIRKCRSFWKDSAVYPWYELLSNAVGLWSVFLPLSAHKRMNEIVEESQKLANPIWQRYEKTGYRYPFHEEVLKERKIEKKSLSRTKCCSVRINFLAINIWMFLSAQVSIPSIVLSLL